MSFVIVYLVNQVCKVSTPSFFKDLKSICLICSRDEVLALLHLLLILPLIRRCLQVHMLRFFIFDDAWHVQLLEWHIVSVIFGCFVFTLCVCLVLLTRIILLWTLSSIRLYWLILISKNTMYLLLLLLHCFKDLLLFFYICISIRVMLCSWVPDWT